MAEIGLYGNTALKRQRCGKCRTTAIVLDGEIQCCGRKVEEKARTYRQMSPPVFKRRTPSQQEQLRILSEQDNRCLYCGLHFGTKMFRGAKILELAVRWDHYIPFSVTANNSAQNFVAACQVCNGIKSSRIFESLEEARKHIFRQREKKGYSLA